jgi:hypothetical protein
MFGGGRGAMILGHATASKWIATAGSLMTIAGLLQADVSGWFESVAAAYSDSDKYPSGPPSHLTHELHAVPEDLILHGLSDILFKEQQTAFWLVVFGTLLQVLAMWL